VRPYTCARGRPDGSGHTALTLIRPSNSGAAARAWLAIAAFATV
jgi:hypothetical protein